ncbi:MAG: orotidine-5'-phosphate decarboxylase [Flavobacteriales bacterium]
MAHPRTSPRPPASELTTTGGLFEAICAKGSYLCVGLDPDPNRIPASFGSGVEGMEAFCRTIVESTLPYAVAFKPNLAFFEQYGSAGWAALERVVEAIPSDVLVIADAKRGDIGNTATKYASAMFHGLGADAVTVAPYMGRDSVEPFTAFSDRWTVLLALTSNPGAEDFEFHGERPLFQEVLRKTQTYRNADRLMYVVGATRPALFQDIRVEVPQAFLLVPGVGAQGGSVTDVAQFGLNDRCGLLVNSSRGILYAAGSEATQAQVRQASAEAAEALATEMRSTLVHRGLL